MQTIKNIWIFEWNRFSDLLVSKTVFWFHLITSKGLIPQLKFHFSFFFSAVLLISFFTFLGNPTNPKKIKMFPKYLKRTWFNVETCCTNNFYKQELNVLIIGGCDCKNMTLSTYVCWSMPAWKLFSVLSFMFGLILNVWKRYPAKRVI